MMIMRSRFGNDMSVHEEQTVIGQIPPEALEYERMFAQRTQPPPPDEANAGTEPAGPPLPDMSAPRAPFPSTPSASDEAADATAEAPGLPEVPERGSGSANGASPETFPGSGPPSRGEKNVPEERPAASLTETAATGVARSFTARRLRVALLALLVLAAGLLWFAIRVPR